MEAWFAGVIRVAFALTVLGDNPSFADIATCWLRVRLSAAGSTDPRGGALYPDHLDASDVDTASLVELARRSAPAAQGPATTQVAGP